MQNGEELTAPRGNPQRIVAREMCYLEDIWQERLWSPT